MKQSYLIRHLDEIEEVAELLASQFPDPGKARLGMHELILNAHEHGNLGISYDEKTKLIELGIWRQEVLHRQSMPQYQHRKTEVHLVRDSQALTLYIRDEGEGFDWQRYLHTAPERLQHPHGRGIAIASRMCFDRLIYSQKGNETIATTVL